LKLKAGDPTAMESVTVLPKLGSLSHEGLEIDDAGNVYVIDEDRKGSIYKFVPTAYGNLTEGQLYALKVDAVKTGSAPLWPAVNAGPRGKASFVLVNFWPS
jgi:secreted PhoX family phosphatase